MPRLPVLNVSRRVIDLPFCCHVAESRFSYARSDAHECSKTPGATRCRTAALIARCHLFGNGSCPPRTSGHRFLSCAEDLLKTRPLASGRNWRPIPKDLSTRFEESLSDFNIVDRPQIVTCPTIRCNLKTKRTRNVRVLGTIRTSFGWLSICANNIDVTPASFPAVRSWRACLSTYRRGRPTNRLRRSPRVG